MMVEMELPDYVCRVMDLSVEDLRAEAYVASKKKPEELTDEEHYIIATYSNTIFRCVHGHQEFVALHRRLDEIESWIAAHSQQ